MNPLTLVKRIQSINSKEAALGISEEASWHAKYKDSAYVFVGGIPFDLTEGDLLAVFAQYGEIVDVNLVRDKGTGKSKGFAFIAYEDQRSTNLAVDNLNGAQILGRVIRVDHVTKYKKKEEEDEETEQLRREARGVCRAFQRGECTRGATCKFSHDEQRAADTGWGPEDKGPRWGHDKFEGPKKNDGRSGNERPSESQPKKSDRGEEKRSRRDDYEIEQKSRQDYNRKEEKSSKRHGNDEIEPKSRQVRHSRDEKKSKMHRYDEFKPMPREDHSKSYEKGSGRLIGDKFEPRSREDHDKREKKASRRHGDGEFKPREDDGRDEKRSRRHESESYIGENHDNRGGKWSGRAASSHHRREG